MTQTGITLFVGTDIVEVARIERALSEWKMDFLQRVFTPGEIIKINADNPDHERAAGFWAAKESMVKALGSGFRHGIRFHDIEIIHDEYGCPHILLHGEAKKVLTKKGSAKISLTISHCRTYAIAVVAVVTHN
ncbi:holo-[acyl-carrier protein] synthase [Pantoea alhagi]|uniref:holo-ACP synthase n=1 Tax=Mixta sp. BE291 TaxID=3158787 RepID=UPI0028624BB8|nr:holo-[acyl-carrier protein] synthase [Pantoea alhagi]